MEETNIEKNEKYILEEIKKHEGWCEVKIKNFKILCSIELSISTS